jgi:signal transduction histidine kinase
MTAAAESGKSTRMMRPSQKTTKASQDSWRRKDNRPVVLIVDDIADNLLAFEAMLRRDDIEIVTANSGRAALEILLAQDVAVAIIDVQMPEMDGFELASFMRSVEKTRYVPIIFVTAGSRNEARVFQGYEAGAVDYLFKPVDERVLRGKMDVFVALEKHRQELREADRMREMFIAVLGHDLRDPLSGILMSAHLMQRRSASDDPNNDIVQRIVQNGQRMRRMIEQLLDATRFRGDGSVALDPSPADVRRLTDQILSEFVPATDRFLLDVVGDPVGTWDSDRLLQVLSNLIGNAARHSPADSPIRIAIDGSSRDTVSVRVHNGGPAIPKELRPILFEPFRRVAARRRGEEGLGLGLYITKQIIDAHGGTVSFASAVDEGTWFLVTLPRHLPASRTSATTGASATQARATTAAKPMGQAILLVEDDAASRMALDDLLQGHGYRVLVAAQPSQALDLAAKHNGPIDVLLTDLRLPEMTGTELAEQLRSSYPQLRVVFMSGLPAAPAGAAAFVQKPIDFDHLIKVIERTRTPREGGP